MLFSPYITPEFNQVLSNFFPASVESKPYRRFIMYLCFGTWKMHEDNQLSLSQHVLAVLENRVSSLKNNHYNASLFLDSIRQNLLPDLQVSDYAWQDRSRTLVDAGFPADFQQTALAAELASREKPDFAERAIHYWTGNGINIKNLLADKREMIASATELTGCVDTCDLQDRFLSYLNGIPEHVLTRLVRTNYEHARDVAMSIEHPVTREHNLKMLSDIRFFPKPVYSARANTPRLFAIGSSITYLKRDVRKALTRGLIECDIKNCHLAVIAKDWGIPELQAFLATGESFWSYLATFIPEAATTHKDALKTALYALVYGDSRRHITAALPGDLGSLFFAVPLVKTIHEAREVEMDRITNDPTHRVDCFGKEIAWSPPPEANPRSRRSERSILSQKAQAVELRLLEPMLDIGTEKDRAALVVLYQFDGFSVNVTDKRRLVMWVERLKKKMDKHFAALGYNTELTYEILGEDNV